MKRIARFFARISAAVYFAVVACVLLGCKPAQVDRAVVYTEEGITAAERMWDVEFHHKLDECMQRCEPATPCAEACFGPMFEADKQVFFAVRTMVSLLRGYWVARAAGKSPDWAAVMSQIAQIVGDLPPPARQYFERVKGIP